MSEQFDDRSRGNADDPDDIDARFREIIAGWEPPTDPAEPANPESTAPQPTPTVIDLPMLPPHGIPEVGGARPFHPTEGGDAADSSTADPIESGWRSYEPTEPDDHFEPPAPTLPPAHDATFWLAIVGVVGGPLMILWATLLSGNPDPGWWVVAGIAATVVGFGLIVLRGSTERDPDDDGARV